MKRKPNLPAWTFWAIAVLTLVVMCARPGHAADTVTVAAECTGTAPCLAWRFTLDALPRSPPALYVTGFDFDSPNEGVLTVNGHAVTLFGPEAGPANDRQTRTIGYQTEASWWQAGANAATITWTTDTANDPGKHQVTAMAVQYTPASEWAGPVVCLRRNPSRLVYGFRNTITGVRTAFAIEYSGPVHARVKALIANYQAGQGAGPLDLTGLVQLTPTPEDIAALWSTESNACAR